MAMLDAARRGPIAQINITPMIDVLLVLLILFMVIQPNLSHGLDALVPQEDANSSDSSQRDESIVVCLLADGTLLINNAPLEEAAVVTRLRQVFTGRPYSALFIKAAPELPFEKVAKLIDSARSAGIARIALMPGGD